MKSYSFLYGLLLIFVIPMVLSGAEPITVSNSSHLFLDDFLIDRMTNLRRQVHPPSKHPANPLIKQDFPWEKRMIETYGTVLFDASIQKFRCWYLASESPDSSPEYYVCYAESEDGITWKKPLVGETPFGAHQKHNIVLRGGHGISVLSTPDDSDPGRRYKATGGDLFAWSPDGLHWTTENCRYAVRKNDTGSSFVQWKGEYLWFVRNQEPETGTRIFDPMSGKHWSGTMRGVGLSVSTDFKTWSPKESILRTDLRDNFPWGQPHALCVTPYGDILIGLLPILSLYPDDDNNSFGPWDVQLVVSRDGRKWDRVADRQVFMPHAPEVPLESRLWDARFHPSSTMFVKDDLIYIYYYGANKLHGEGRHLESEISETHYGIGLATLPVDRFVSLRPYDWLRSGEVHTKLLKFKGTDLVINAEVEAENLHVELVDASGRTFPGFELESSVAERCDPLRFRILWKSGDLTRTLQDVPHDTPVRLRISIRDGDLFSFAQVP